MTPFAPFMPSGFWTDLRKGGAEADQAISRFVFGTGIFATVASLATGEMTQGFRINGRGPKNRQAQEAIMDGSRLLLVLLLQPLTMHIIHNMKTIPVY